MADRYVVAAGNWSSTAVWSTSSGGAPGASVPGSGDKVIIDALSPAGTLVVDQDVDLGAESVDGSAAPAGFTWDMNTPNVRTFECEDFNLSAGTFQQNKNSTLTINGDGTFGDVLSFDGTDYGHLVMTGSGTLKMPLNGVTAWTWDTFTCADAGETTTLRPSSAATGKDFNVADQLITAGGTILWDETDVAPGDHMGFEHFGRDASFVDVVGNPTIDGGEFEHDPGESSVMNQIGEYTFANTRGATMGRALDVTGNTATPNISEWEFTHAFIMDYSPGAGTRDARLEKISNLYLRGGGLIGLRRMYILGQTSGDKPSSIFMEGGQIICSEQFHWQCACAATPSFVDLGAGGTFDCGYWRIHTIVGNYRLTGSAGARVRCSGVVTPGATPIYVSSDGNDANTGLTKPQAKETIGGALAIATGAHVIIFRLDDTHIVPDLTALNVTGLQLGSDPTWSAGGAALPTLKLQDGEELLFPNADVEMYELDVQFGDALSGGGSGAVTPMWPLSPEI